MYNLDDILRELGIERRQPEPGERIIKFLPKPINKEEFSDGNN